MPVLAFISAAFAALTAVWAVFWLPGLVSTTAGLMDFCQTLFIRCVEGLQVLKLFFTWAGPAVVALGLMYGLSRASVRLLRAHRAVKVLPVAGRKGRMVLVRDPGMMAFTYGLSRPRIYISTGLTERLSRDEIKTVLRHEAHHLKSLDPLKIFVSHLLWDSFLYIPALGAAVVALKTMIERRADDASVKSKGDDLILAGALVKVASSNIRPEGVAFTGPRLGERIKRLVEGVDAPLPGPSLKAIVLSVASSALIAASVIMPAYASSPAVCTETHCAAHIYELGDSCVVHCSDSGRTEKGHLH